MFVPMQPCQDRKTNNRNARRPNDSNFHNFCWMNFIYVQAKEDETISININKVKRAWFSGYERVSALMYLRRDLYEWNSIMSTRPV